MLDQTKVKSNLINTQLNLTGDGRDIDCQVSPGFLAQFLKRNRGRVVYDYAIVERQLAKILISFFVATVEARCHE
jgi:hypothetical protein